MRNECWEHIVGWFSPRLLATPGIRGSEAKCRGRHPERLRLQTEVQEPRLLLPGREPIHFRQVSDANYVLMLPGTVVLSQLKHNNALQQVDRSAGHRHQRLRGVRLDTERLRSERSWGSFGGGGRGVHCVLNHQMKPAPSGCTWFSALLVPLGFTQNPTQLMCCVVQQTAVELLCDEIEFCIFLTLLSPNLWSRLHSLYTRTF